MILRVLKLGLMAALGYAAYQFVRGILEGEAAPAEETAQHSTPRPISTSTASNITGGGSGHVVKATDAAGASVPHRVGRGVVRR